MRKRRKKTIVSGLFLLGLLGLLGCSSPSSDSAPIGDTQEISALESANEAESGELVYEGSMELQYAENFSVDYYEGGYRMLKTMDGTQLLVVPEGKKIPANLPPSAL